MHSSLAKLRTLKDYRTPQVTRSYTRIFILILPWIYGPYFLYLAGEGNHGGVDIYFAMVFAVLVQIAFMGLYSSEHSLEVTDMGGR